MPFSVVYSSISGMVGLIMTNEKWEETLLICVSIPGFWAPQKVNRTHKRFSRLLFFLTVFPKGTLSPIIMEVENGYI